MSYLLIWLLKLSVTVFIGYLIYKLYGEIANTKTINKIDKKFQEELKANSYGPLNEDIEAIKNVQGLKARPYKGLPHQKPQFYFGLTNTTSEETIILFLKSLPPHFVVTVPSLKISSADAKSQNLAFWKDSDQFHLAITQTNEVYKPLDSITLQELSSKIFQQSSEYSFQTVTVQRVVF